MVIVGGGLAGLSTGCYGRASGFRTTIVEHNIALGGVCTAWSRGPYTVDGCIHWLTGGPFDRIYRELGILPKVSTHVLDLFARYQNPRAGTSISITRDLGALGEALTSLAPEDAAEIGRILDGAQRFATLEPPLDAPELASARESLRRFWGMRHDLDVFVHFRKPFGQWQEHLTSPVLRRLLARLLPPEAPALFVLMVLGYLGRGYLSRPDGGTARFRDALIDTYHGLGGQDRLHATVEEVVVKDDRACGVRLSDGTIVDADVVVSTASAPETVLRLLGGRYGAAELRSRLERWKLFDPIVLASFGVAAPLSGVPPTLLIDDLEPFQVGGRTNDNLYVRIFNDDATMAPAGHTVVQVMATTDYDSWAKYGTRYASEKDAVAETLLEKLEPYVPIAAAVRMTDVATPLTYWNMARSWRGAFEGWLPSPDAFFGHVKKVLPGLSAFYMAGQWVEPGGGVPTALLSGRQVTQLVCADAGLRFAAPVQSPVTPA
jgi:phytoene dehydrogenase-like protein